MVVRETRMFHHTVQTTNLDKLETQTIYEVESDRLAKLTKLELKSRFLLWLIPFDLAFVFGNQLIWFWLSQTIIMYPHQSKSEQQENTQNQVEVTGHRTSRNREDAIYHY